MKKSLTLSIPNPCGEDWNSFTPTDTGGFCASCNKNVVDFTHASETEIISFFKSKPAYACGRFRADQLKTYYLPESGSIKPGFMLLRAGMISLLLLLIGKPGISQTTASKSNTEIVQHPDNSPSALKKEIRVTGVVTSSEDGSPLPGVSVVLRGTAIGTQTDGEGRFELDVDLEKSETLVFSFIGLETQSILTHPNLNVYKVSMKEDSSQWTTGIIVIAGMVGPGRPLDGKSIYTEKPPLFKRVWTGIKHAFVTP